MKILKHSLSFALLLSLFSFSGAALAAPDRIGNGGGVWMCEGPSGEIFDLMFMDIFEARREYQLNIPEVSGSYLDAVAAKKKWIAANLEMGAKLNEHIVYVEKTITWIDDVIVSIPDAANKIIPHPSLCKQGKWTAVQLVNFTDDLRILVRRELFESPLMTEMERAAVYLHEGIYSYLRTEKEDTNSVRARAIVGVIFSDLGDTEKVSRISKILGAPSQKPPAKEEPLGYVCGLKADPYAPLYIAEHKDEMQARALVVEECKKGENPMPPGFPFPFFPGAGDNFPGPGTDCKPKLVACEQILTTKKEKVCSVTDFFDRNTYHGAGRTRLEAQKEAIEQCLVNEGDTSDCYRSSKMKCN